MSKWLWKLNGRFHALSFALKDLKPSVFDSLTRHIQDPLLNVDPSFGTHLGVVKNVIAILDPVKDASKIFEESITYPDYHGEYFAILQFNNIVFKNTRTVNWTPSSCWIFNYRRLVLRFTIWLIFSVVRYPENSSTELFHKLYCFLNIYHESFSKFVTELGSDPETVFPITQLKKDWHKHAKFGMLMALALTKIKFIPSETLQEMVGKTRASFVQEVAFYHSEDFLKRARDIVRHMADINAL